MKNTLIFLLFVLVSCSTGQKKTESFEYKEQAAVYRSEHLTHLPKSRPRGFSLIGHGAMYIGAYDFARGFIIYEAPKQKLKEIMDSLQVQSLRVYSAADENILVLNSSESLKNMGVSKKEYRSHMDEYNYLAENGELPVPNFSFMKFEDFYGIKTQAKCMLPDDFKIYVLDAEPGVAYKAQRACEYLMPEKWKEGFTRGVSVSLKHKMVLYWFATW